MFGKLKHKGKKKKKFVKAVCLVPKDWTEAQEPWSLASALPQPHQCDPRQVLHFPHLLL